LAHRTNFCFLPYNVCILAPGEAAWEESDPATSWSAVWVGREYRQLHRAPIPLKGKPQDHILRECAHNPIARPHTQRGGVDERDDGSVSRVWLYHDGCNPRHDSKHWNSYVERLGKLVRHLEPDADKCGRDDPCQPYFLNPRRS